ncbi:O-antigen ligase family protein [Candidatus Falkowbacteria bacterium]|nr:O-antigen ligase family protein [Candidatus Falkowbacteria bacterium]
MNILKKNKILTVFLLIFLVEMLSLISFKIAWLSGLFFVLICTGVFLITWKKLEYGIYVVLTELIIGSQGYLFYLVLPGFKASIRLGIFLIVFFVWLIKYLKPRIFLNLLKRDALVQNFILLLIFVAFGTINGIINKNGLTNVFFDVNGYLYFGLFFAFLEVFKSIEQIKKFLKIFIGAMIYECTKVFLTLYLFSHDYFINASDLFYHWIRDTRVGEITYAGGNFFRIFFQSQIWALIGIFIIICLIIWVMQKKPLCHPERSEGSKTLGVIDSSHSFGMTERVWLFLLLTIIQTSIIISFSRSFWVGAIAAFIILLGYLVFIYKPGFKIISKIIGISASSLILSIFLVIFIANFPIPKPSSELSAQLIGARFLSFFGEAGVSSRWNELPSLLEKIKQSPVFGSGHGTTITFKSEDPRIKNEQNPEGWYTTYTFEWGYLDTLIEIGILGLLVCLVFIGQIAYMGLKTLKNKEYGLISAGLLLGLVAMLVTHMFSPYLNHPLGIGYLMLCASIFKSKPSD